MSLKRNIPLYYVYEFLASVQFYGPIFALFFQSFGLNQTQILTFLSVFAISTIIFEIPTGVFSDYLGRKKTLFISALLLTGCFLLVALGTAYWHFILAYLIMGFSSSFKSGTDESFLYDTLIKLKQKDRFKAILGKTTVLATASMAFSFSLGSYLYTLNSKLPYFLTALLIALSAILILFFTEPQHAKTKKGVLHHTTASFKLLLRHKILRSLTVFKAVTICSIVLSYFLIQQYYASVGIPAAYFGIIMVGSMAATALTAKSAHTIETFLKEKLSLMLIPLLIIVGYFLLAFIQKPYSFLFVYLLSIAMGFSGPVLSDYANKHIPSDKRATILSITNQLKNILFFITPPLIGIIAERSIPNAFITIAIATALVTLPLLAYFITIHNHATARH